MLKNVAGAILAIVFICYAISFFLKSDAKEEVPSLEGMNSEEAAKKFVQEARFKGKVQLTEDISLDRLYASGSEVIYVYRLIHLTDDVTDKSSFVPSMPDEKIRAMCENTLVFNLLSLGMAMRYQYVDANENLIGENIFDIARCVTDA
jgi:hypothetical protein